MDIDWPYKKRELGDEIVYHCPNNKLPWVEQLEEQVVRCIWHRQTDTMMWWPQDIHDCNSESHHSTLPSPRLRSDNNNVSILVRQSSVRAFQVLSKSSISIGPLTGG